MRGSVLLLLAACGSEDVVPPDVVRVQLLEDGEPFRNVPVFFGNADGSLANETETDLDGIAEARVGETGMVTIFIRDAITSIYGVEAGTQLVYDFPFDSGVRAPIDVGAPGANPDARNNGYRVTDGCGGGGRFSPSTRVSWEAEWQCVGQTGDVELVAWAEAQGGAVVGVSTLDVDVPIAGIDDGGTFPNWSTSLAEITLDWSNRSEEGPNASVAAIGVRDGRRHRGTRRNLGDPDGSVTLAYGPDGFPDFVDLEIDRSLDNHLVRRVVRRAGGARVATDLTDLEPAVEGALDISAGTVDIERLREPADVLATTVQLELTDEDGITFPFTGVGAPDIAEFVVPELPGDEWSVGEDLFRIGLVAGDTATSAEYIGGHLFREPGQGATPIREGNASWTFWIWNAPDEAPMP